MERDTHLAKLREWFTLLQSEQARRFTTSTNECEFTTALGWALEQLRDAAQIAQQPSRSELMRHAVQRGGRPMDVAALPAPVGGQTPPLALFEPDESNECGNCQTRGFSLQCTAARGHAGLHVAHNPAGKVLGTWEVGGQTPTDPPQERPLCVCGHRIIDHLAMTNGGRGTCQKGCGCQFVTTTAPPPPGAPAAEDLGPLPDCPRCHGTGEEDNPQFRCHCRWSTSPLRVKENRI